MANFFDTIDDDSEEIEVPASLKKSLTSEINTIRSTMEVVNLYVSNLFGTAGAVLGNQSSKDNESDPVS
jgi:hypothetical protein